MSGAPATVDLKAGYPRLRRAVLLGVLVTMGAASPACRTDSTKTVAAGNVAGDVTSGGHGLVVDIRTGGADPAVADLKTGAGGHQAADVKAGQASSAAVDARIGSAAGPSGRGAGTLDCMVNGSPLTRERIAALATRDGLTEDAARRRLSGAMLVAAEALRSGFPGAGEAVDPLVLADSYLQQVFSRSTLCGNITERQLRQFYEVSYQPGWTVDVYQGDVVELRCCPSLADKCPAEQVKGCREKNREVTVLLEQVGRDWKEGRAPSQADLDRQNPALRLTDFGFAVFPGIPLERQKGKTLFDLPALRRIMALKPGDVSVPFESELGFHVVRLNRFRPAITAESPEFLEAGREELCRQRVEQTRKDYVSRLLQAAVIEPPLPPEPSSKP